MPDMQVEHRIRTHAPPEVVFRIYEDVERWHTWDPDTRQAWLDGPLLPGARGRLTPTRGRTVPMVVTAVEAGRSFTVESRIPLFRMVFDHELRPGPDGTEVTHRVQFHGLLSVVLGPMLIRQLNTGLPVTLARLRDLAESGATPG
jgi:Polyketide cyclase / dehydrase and lipid transport